MHITLNKQDGPADQKIFSSNSLIEYFLSSNQTNNNIISYPHVLQIDRLTGKTQQINIKEFNDIIKQEGYERKKQIYSIYGKSINRLINASLTDNFKDQCNQYLLNEHQNSHTTYFTDNISHQYLKIQQFCDFYQVSLTVLTWNVAGLSAAELTQAESEQIYKKLFSSKKQSSDLVFITLQEIVQLNTLNIVTNNNLVAKESWEQVFIKMLNFHAEGCTYKLYFSLAMVGIASFVFVKSSKRPENDYLNRIKKCFSYEVKRGASGTLGNKGAIVSAFSIYDTVIINFACHLAAHDHKANQRADDINEIFRSLESDKLTYKYYKNCDYMFFKEDLNFRMTIPDEQVYNYIEDSKKLQNKIDQKSNTLKELSEKCQYFSLHNKSKYLKKFTESPITFYPTFKYQKQGENYDRKRKPGYCDRILHFESYKNTIKFGSNSS